jgi:hypothetical protein
MKKKQGSLWLMFVMAAGCATAQTAGYHYKAAINPVKESGLYNIVFTPAVTAHLKTDYSDLRIVNDAGKWVPHLLRTINIEKSADKILLMLPFVKKENATNNTELIITSHSSISNVFLKMKNTAAERYGTLTGSDDAKNWFVINDSILIKPSKMDDENEAGLNIYFPQSNYSYYKIIINNKGKSPFNILGVQTTGLANNTSLHKSVVNPDVAIFQQDSGKYSYVRVTQSAAYHFDEIQLKISGVKYFYRNVELYIPSSANHSILNPGQWQQSFIISNNSTLQYKIPLVNATVFYLVISNQDNLPLKIEAVKTFNSYHTATAYLEKEKKYELMLGNTAASAPSYDLQQLNISTATSLPEATFGNIVAINQPFENGQKEDCKWMVWLAIATAGLVLCFFTYKLVKDMNKEKK